MNIRFKMADADASIGEAVDTRFQRERVRPLGTHQVFFRPALVYQVGTNPDGGRPHPPALHSVIMTHPAD